jgi:flagellar biosynthesis repressor protein FlbT
MALKITLKPHERMIVGGTVITNGNTKANLVIETNVPILRNKDIMTERDATTPACRIYFTVQLMYIDEANLAAHHNAYWRLVEDLLAAAPSALPHIDMISEQIVNQNYYKALKAAKKLIAFEVTLVKGA